MSRQRSPKQIAREVERQGFRVKETRSGFVAYSKTGIGMVAWHRTPSDHRAHKNLIANLKRIGVRL